MPHIGLNLIFLVPGEVGGMETYARELLPRLFEQRPEWRFTVFAGKEATEWMDELPSDVEKVTVPVRASNRVEWVRGEQQFLPRLCRKHEVDLLHSLANTAPVWGHCKRVLTINDLHYKLVPEAHFGLRGLGVRLLVPAAAKRSDRIIAISHNTASDIERYLQIDSGKVDVIHDGVEISVDVASTSAEQLRDELTLGSRRVLLTFSAKRPHKNLMRLIDAVALVPAEARPVLIMPGYSTPYEDELKQRVRELELDSDVRFLGWVSASDAEGLYGLATAFVFPSLYEGFGLPVLEAMARGLPVACSDRSSLPEIAGDAALLFDPDSTDAIRKAIQALMTDEILATRLGQAGITQAKKFTWDRCAAETVVSYERALSSE